jgi:hypothetical protein
MTADIARAAEFNSRAPQPGRPQTTVRPQPAASSVETPPSAVNPSLPAAQAAPAPPAEAPAFDLTDFFWDRIAYMISNHADGDEIAQWLNFSAPDMIQQLKAFTEGGLLQMLESQPNIKAALEGKDAPLLARQFLYFCRTGEFWPEEEEEAQEVPEPVTQ